MTIVSLTGADIAQVFENGQHILCVKLRYEQGVIHSNSLCSTVNDGYYCAINPQSDRRGFPPDTNLYYKIVPQ